MPEFQQRQSRRHVPDGGRRLRALRVLLGDGTPGDLAERIQVAGLGAHTIRDIETGRRGRAMWDYQAVAIAHAVGVPPSYFTAPLSRLGDTG